MKYFVLKLLTNKETKETKKSVYEFKTEKEARINLHAGYSAALNDSSLEQVLCMMIDNYGSQLATLNWIERDTSVNNLDDGLSL